FRPVAERRERRGQAPVRLGVLGSAVNGFQEVAHGLAVEAMALIQQTELNERRNVIRRPVQRLIERLTGPIHAAGRRLASVALAQKAGEAGIVRRQALRLLPDPARPLTTLQHLVHSSKPVVPFHAPGRLPEMLLETGASFLQAPERELRPAQDE